MMIRAVFKITSGARAQIKQTHHFITASGCNNVTVTLLSNCNAPHVVGMTNFE